MSNVPRSDPIPIPARRGEEYFVPWRQFSKGRSVVEECRAFPRAQSVSREDLEYFLRSVHYRCDYVRLRARRRLEDNGNGNGNGDGDDWAGLPNYS
ncbi:uncharacterized protein LOC126355783 isoform X2 [Schistocerca gregaria]|nr:uncharacterized protein LOC126355783 isoform X2 [Schistocerca gregaria]